MFPPIGERPRKEDYEDDNLKKCCEIGSYECQVILDIPVHMEQYKINRVKAGLSDKICIDKCIVDKIEELWSKGIITYGCCCGHGEQESMVNVDEKNIQQMIDMGYIMIDMGYIMNHKDKSRRNTFKL